MEKPRVGISACLLGQRVRHDGGDKRNDWLVEVLGRFVTWVPLCPEIAMGLGVPRPTLRLHGKRDNPQLIERGTGRNLTALAHDTAGRLLDRDLSLDSYIFKKDSPSCGLERVKVYGKNDIPARSATGLFAAEVLEKLPQMPVIEEGRLSDLSQRELYVTRLFAFANLKRLPLRISALQAFHQNYKLLLMAHAPVQYARLGRVAANSERRRASEVMADYQRDFLEAIRKTPTRKQWCNTLEHMLGHFKKILSARDKQHVLQALEEFRRGELPLVAPLTLIRYLAQKHEVAYLQTQAVFEPFPRALLFAVEHRTPLL